MPPISTTPRFTLGFIVATPAALAVTTHPEILDALKRHVTGDWGEVSAEDVQANEDALVHGARLLSAYKTATGERYWIITEADRAGTTVLLPSDY